MSICIAIRQKRRMFLASDSRSTRTTVDGLPSYIDGFQKTIYLENAGAGFTTFGANTFDGVTVCDFLQDMEQKISGSDFRHSFQEICDGIHKLLTGDLATGIYGCKYEKDGFVCLNSNIDAYRTPVIEEAGDVWHNRIYSLRRLYGEKGLEIPGLPDFSEQQLISFAKHLFRTEYEYRIYSNQSNVIGGDMQYVIIDHNGAKQGIVPFICA